MNYVHDLTSTRDFSENRSFNLPKFLQLIEHNIDTSYTSPEKEVVLTGDAETRKMKRYCIDYENDGNICDCCGCDINKKPWDFKKTSKLCDACEKFLEMTTQEEFWDNQDVVVGEDRQGFITKRQKPWDMKETISDIRSPQRATSNVLLWD